MFKITEWPIDFITDKISFCVQNIFKNKQEKAASCVRNIFVGLKLSHNRLKINQMQYAVHLEDGVRCVVNLCIW